MGVYIASFKITGLSPLLMNSPAAMGQAKDDGAVGVKKAYKPAEEAEVRVYRDADGRVILPAEAFRKALIQACTGRKVGKAPAGRLIRGAVFNTDTSVRLTDPKSGKALEKYEIDTRRAIVNKQGIPRTRPMFRNWACTLDMEVDADFIADPEPIRQLLNIAGKTIGVGDFRPDRGGSFGRFQADLAKSTMASK